MKTKALISASAATAVLFTTLLAAAPAQAAPAACQKGQGCTYEDANYQRGHINFYFNVAHYGAVSYWVPTVHTATDNSASSAFHNGNTTQLVKLYDKDHYQGSPKVTLARGKGSANLGSAQFNDKLTSACFAAYCK